MTYNPDDLGSKVLEVGDLETVRGRAFHREKRSDIEITPFVPSDVINHALRTGDMIIMVGNDDDFVSEKCSLKEGGVRKFYEYSMVTPEALKGTCQKVFEMIVEVPEPEAIRRPFIRKKVEGIMRGA